MFDMNFNAEKVLKDLEKEVELTEEQKAKANEALEYFEKFVETISGINLQQ
jgi:hypothetical protein